jgi:hypothetical protein
MDTGKPAPAGLLLECGGRSRSCGSRHRFRMRLTFPSQNGVALCLPPHSQAQSICKPLPADTGCACGRPY